MAATPTLRRIICLAGIALVCFQAGFATAADPKSSSQAKTKPIDKEAWSRKLAGLAESDWRKVFAVGQELTDLPAEEGFAILKENWEQITCVETRQQLLNAWGYISLKMHRRIHPHLLDVLDLGMRDRSPAVRKSALDNLRPIAFQDFAENIPAYKDWYQANRHKAVTKVIAESVQRLVKEIKQTRGEEFYERVRRLYENSDTFHYVPAARQAAVDAGLLPILERWVADMKPGARRDGSELAKAAVSVIGGLKPGEAYLRRVVVPLVAKDKPLELRMAAISALGGKENAWAIDLLLEILKSSLEEDEHYLGFIARYAAEALATIGDPKVIPTMIAIIDADNTYNTVYGIGWFGMNPLTGVRWDEAHNGAWWRRWWDKNKVRYPATVRDLEIPTLVKKVEQVDPSADVADVPAQDLRASDDAKKRYFLIGVRKEAKPPAEGYGLLIVLPGGDGSAEFQPFVRKIYKDALNKRWLIAQAVAPKWDDKQFEQVVWPTEGLPYPAAKFTTEAFIKAIIADVRTKLRIDRKRIFLLGWSSGGPPCYATALRKDSPATGAFIAMSVFKPKQMPALGNAKGKAFYLLQSPQDRITRLHFAEEAEKALREAGAKVRLQRYEGGHGWHGDFGKIIGDGIRWLEQQVGESSSTP